MGGWHAGGTSGGGVRTCQIALKKLAYWRGFDDPKKPANSKSDFEFAGFN